MAAKSTHIAKVEHRIALADRWNANRHRSGVVWLTGLSGSGKTTLAFDLEARLFVHSWRAYGLDGDNIRFGLGADLGFSPHDRDENIRRVGEVAALGAEAGLIAVTAFISPYRAGRARARAAVKRLIGPGAFDEIHLAATLAVCEARDPKGLYARARRGEISDFTGIDASYEAPETPELVLDTGVLTVEESGVRLFAYVTHVLAWPSAQL